MTKSQLPRMEGSLASTSRGLPKATMNIIEDDRPKRIDNNPEAETFDSETILLRPEPQALLYPNVVIKPVALKVVRPISQRASEQFYNEAYEEGLTNQQTSRATIMAHEWHRKWTQQEETHHDQVDQDFYQQETMLPLHYDVDRKGASNPFKLTPSDDSSTNLEGVKRIREDLDVLPHVETLEDDRIEQLLLNPEDRLSSPSWSQTIESTLTSSMSPQLKRRNIADVAHIEAAGGQPMIPLPLRPMTEAVRPVPVRTFVLPTHIPPSSERNHIPRNVTAFRELEAVSPMSFTSVSPSPDDDLLNTILEHPNDEVHLIEEEEESTSSEHLAKARDGILHALAATKGEVDSDLFKKALDSLLKHFPSHSLDTRLHLTDKEHIEGMWLQLSKPSYFGCLGENEKGDPMYTLGRMAFDMFSPTHLVCSLQGNFNPVEIVNEGKRKTMLDQVPTSLVEEVESGETILRTYDIVTAFTIEPCSASFPDAPNKDVVRPIKGIMTIFGYSLPDPNVQNRHSIWFTGGSLQPNNNPTDIAAWKELFTLHPPKHTFGEKAKLLAVKLLMGATIPEAMDKDGRMDFAFTRPLGGHNKSYVDVIYLDDTLRVVRGHRGTIMAFARMKK